ncbi:hypothetical protein R5R35_003741 [Gryllus longicercus]|uniref:F-box domain-containing protein n=1 Tax=Gryllus longicercus TaxID=2509291 RepID=A0AAN9ZDI8_9ORTH
MIWDYLNLAPSTSMTEDLTDGLVGLGALPDVPLLKIFSYLGIKEKLQCSQVCKKWNSLIFTSSPWRTLNITCRDGKWDRSEMNYYDSQNCCELYTGRRWLLLDGGYLRIVDSTLALLDVVLDIKQEMPLYKRVISEYRLLIGCLENVLPKVGPSVKNLFLNANSGVSDFIFNLYLILCPNIERLDARFTALSGKAFQGLAAYGSCRKIKGLNLMGCKRVTDATLCNLVECWSIKPVKSTEEEVAEKSIEVPYCAVYVHDVCSGFITVDDYVSETCDVDPYKRNIMTFVCPPNAETLSSGLKFLSLAGCTQITDKGLEYLANCKYVTSLELLDVSGCSGLTSKGLNLLAKACPRLKPYNLFYCDMILDGPFSEEANGCQTEGGECCMN